MTVELKPEDEALIRDRLQTGDGTSVEDVVHRALLGVSKLGGTVPAAAAAKKDPF